MNKKLYALFDSIENLEPPRDLEKLILNRIELKKKTELRKNLFWAYFSLIGSAGAAIFTGLTFGQTILQSEFWSIATLVFSDAGVVLNNLSDFSSSLLETIPVVNIIAILLPVFTLTLSLSWYLKLPKNNPYNHYKFI